MYSKIHDYINKRIAESDVKKLREWEDAFNLANIPSSVIDRSYHIFIPSIVASGQNSRTIEHRVNVQLSYFRKGFKTPRDAQLQGLDECFCLIQAIVNPLKWNDPSYMIYRVNCDQVTQNPVEGSNDNLIFFQMNFSFGILAKTTAS